MGLETPTAEEVPKHGHRIDYAMAGEVLENYVSLNVGRILNVWYSLVRGLSSLRKSVNSDAAIGLAMLGKISIEIEGIESNRTSEDEVIRYIIKRLASNRDELKVFSSQVNIVRRVLEKVDRRESVGRSERAEAERVLLRLLDQLKPIARRHQDKFTALLLGTELAEE